MRTALGALVVLLAGCCGCAAPAPAAPWEPISHSYYCDYKTPADPSCRHRI